METATLTKEKRINPVYTTCGDESRDIWLFHEIFRILVTVHAQKVTDHGGLNYFIHALRIESPITSHKKGIGNPQKRQTTRKNGHTQVCPGSLAHHIADINQVEYNGRSLLFYLRRQQLVFYSFFFFSFLFFSFFFFFF